MTIFLSGGCKNGKSTLAQHAAKKLAGDGPLYYIATMIPHDEEDRARIRRHLHLHIPPAGTVIQILLIFK